MLWTAAGHDAVLSSKVIGLYNLYLFFDYPHWFWDVDKYISEH